MFDESHRALQRQFDTERLADRIAERLCHDRFTADDRAFIEQRDMFFLATADASGRPNCSYKGGDPGFVRILDERTLVFPHYDGNGMFLSLGNLSATHQVGMLFIDFENPKRLRVNGEARIEPASFVSPSYLEVELVVVVTPREVFPNCPRYIHKQQRVERSEFVPRDGKETPSPKWKQSDWARDVLPKTGKAPRDK